MKKRLTPRWVIIKLTGLLFAAYSAYIFFMIIRDLRRGMAISSVIICVVIAVLFQVLAGFALTSEIKNMQFRTIRRVAFIAAFFSVFLLKLRMAGQVAAYVDFSKIETVLFGISYLLTQIALLITAVNYTFIRKNRPQFPKTSIVLPIVAIVFFVGSLALEAVLFIVFNIGVEGNLIRNVVIRPVFYLGFISLSVYLLYPPQVEELMEYDVPDDSELVVPEDDEYHLPEGGVEMPDGTDLVMDEGGEYRPPEGGFEKPDGMDLIMAEEGEYRPPEGSKPERSGETEFVMSDDGLML